MQHYHILYIKTQVSNPITNRYVIREDSYPGSQFQICPWDTSCISIINLPHLKLSLPFLVSCLFFLIMFGVVEICKVVLDFESCLSSLSITWSPTVTYNPLLPWKLCTLKRYRAPKITLHYLQASMKSLRLSSHFKGMACISYIE